MPLLTPLRRLPRCLLLALCLGLWLSHGASAATVIPEILHQVWISANPLPPNWADAHQAWLDLHPTWTSMEWNTTTCRALLEEHYPWFLPQWDEYDLYIQRADVCRYFVLYHYGGVYADYDIRPLRSIEPIIAQAEAENKQVILLEKDSEIVGNRVGGICIGMMASVAQVEFWESVFRMLQYRRWRWYYHFSNHLRVIFGSGPQVVIPVYWENLPIVGRFPAKKFYACHSCSPLPCQREGGWVRFETGGLLWNKADTHVLNFIDCRILRPIVNHLTSGPHVLFAAGLSLCLALCLLSVFTAKSGGLSVLRITEALRPAAVLRKVVVAVLLVAAVTVVSLWV
eukprot:RCo032818